MIGSKHDRHVLSSLEKRQTNERREGICLSHKGELRTSRGENKGLRSSRARLDSAAAEDPRNECCRGNASSTGKPFPSHARSPLTPKLCKITLALE